MSDSSDLAKSYRDLAKLLATIGSGLFIAAGIGATFFSSSIKSALSLTNQGYDLALENSTLVSQANTTGLIQEGVSSSLQAASLSVQLMFFLFNLGFLISCFSIYFWYNSHRVLKGEKREVSLRRPAIGFMISVAVLLLMSFTI